MSEKDLRYIVFILDSKFKQHDGKVFTDIRDAREFGKDCLRDKYGDRIIIGSFVNIDLREMCISFIESFDAKTSVKNLDQLDLFKL